MADVPHLSWPFRLAGTRLAQVEQDSSEAIQQEVHSYLHTAKGERPLSPGFGLEDPTFGPGVEPTLLAAELEEAIDYRAFITVDVSGPDVFGHHSVEVTVDLAQ
jgi:hypothetical protein